MKTASIAVILAVALSPATAFANTTVSAASALVDLGSFSAGQYNITASGLVDLAGSTQYSFLMKPDGSPSNVDYPGYAAYFNPTGSYTADTSYGPAGPNAKIGALIGTFKSNPTSPSDWFLIGYSTQVTAAAGHIYAAVNDTYRPNNTGSFSVSVSAVPEPETYAMMLAGLGLLGIVAGRRRQKLNA